MADFDVSTWSTILAPAATPRDIVMRAATEASKILRDPAMTSRLADIGLLVDGRSPGGTATFLRTEVEGWAG
ncbi:hypothetical protein GXW78_06900 [Roseomonas terrae]|uniref:Uncharacterized protein n=1 Tax=Neoroseomonas terrae TaxID=424799 RepID=A0ABS5EED5_9PROT|nr:hypothetical protein [Neoroseomonas terrae]